LKHYLEQGYLSIDNNLSERTLRAIALGRNNWGVIGSEAGGKTAAVLYTMVGTCKHLGIDPFVYLREALPGLFALGEEPTAEQLLEWLPTAGCCAGPRRLPRHRRQRAKAAKEYGEVASLLIRADQRAHSLCTSVSSQRDSRGKTL
jgi:hypothetical protein